MFPAKGRLLTLTSSRSLRGWLIDEASDCVGPVTGNRKEQDGNETVIVEAVRTPLGKRGGGLAYVHPVDLLASVLAARIERAGIDPALVGQIVGGCVEQVGEQSNNVTRNAWLAAGLPISVAAISVDSACGSSQGCRNGRRTRQERRRRYSGR